MSRVVLAMSGGVDSSVAAKLLLDAGHDVIGVFMRHGEQTSTACTSGQQASASGVASLPIVDPGLSRKQGCCTAADAADGRRVADRLDIPFYAIDFEAEFGRIIDYFVEEYTSARTPNPCVVCNNWLKFGKLCQYADSVGAKYVATGHYARLIPDPTGGQPPALCRGVDRSKDQSYVLFGLDRSLLDRFLLPVGGYQKSQIRDIARGLGLPVAEKKDSQEICFVTQGDYAEFVRGRRGDVDTSGDIVTTDGHVVGRHGGLENFTVGQRKGLKVAFGEPRFVVRLEADTRRVVIGTRDDLARTEMTANRTNWLVDPPARGFRCRVKIRYLSQLAAATVEPLPGDRLRAVLDDPKHGVAPGQALVCYDGDRVLGGGWIE